MPAWNRDGSEGSIPRREDRLRLSGNAARGLPSIMGTYLLMNGATGAPLAAIDGQALTLWRTAAASALAASYLAVKDARRLVMVGAGALAPYLIEAHASDRPIAEVLVWNHKPGRAEELAEKLTGRAYSVSATRDLEAAVRAADIVSCATLSSDPLVKGAWLKPGAHLDLVGAFTPTMRECDDEAVRRARIFVDTRAGALQEAGDIVAAARSRDHRRIRHRRRPLRPLPRARSAAGNRRPRSRSSSRSARRSRTCLRRFSLTKRRLSRAAGSANGYVSVAI